MIDILSNFLQNLLAAGGQDSVKSGLITCTVMAKIAPWWLVRRDNFSAKVPGLVSADGATNVYSLNRRAVSGNALQTCMLCNQDRLKD